MKQQKQDKTNVMRLLDAAGIAYRVQEYEVDENDLSGIHVANQIGEDPDSVFKTLVLKGEKRGFLVCCIPVAEELDLKKVARAVGDQEGGDASHEGTASDHRLYPGWLFSYWHEEKVSYLYRRNSSFI